jgi:hypothetical protein
MSRAGQALVLANVAAVLALALAFPAAMLAPGPPQPAHAALSGDCFACHAPFGGIAGQRCADCHEVEDIGLRLVSGADAPPRPRAAAARPDRSFHAALPAQPCASCHAEHGAAAPPRFAHALLDAPQAADCAACHAAPEAGLHALVDKVEGGCAACHETAGWDAARFDHALLPPAARRACDRCHEAPNDALHADLGGAAAGCDSCHRVAAWRPSTFDHDRHFRLDGDHRAACATCHPGPRAGTVDQGRATCFGCHAHRPAEVQAEHREEGMVNIDDCASCHRSGDEDEAEGRGDRRRGRGQGRGDHDDD